MVTVKYTDIYQFIYSLRTYSFSKRSLRFKQQIASGYENENWGLQRSQFFDGSSMKLPSKVDYERTLSLIDELQRVRNHKLKILDFGGGNLALYHRISIDRPALIFEWVIVENSTYFYLLQRGWGELQEGYDLLDNGFRVADYPNLLVTNQVPACAFDLCIAGAVLGWVDSPIEVRDLLIEKSDYLLITRTLMSHKNSRLGLQRTRIGLNVQKIKCWFLNQEELTRALGFKCVEIWDSSPEIIYTVYGKWRFRSLLLQKIG